MSITNMMAKVPYSIFTMAPPSSQVTHTLTKTTRTNMSAMLCKQRGVVKISRHYGIRAMGLSP